MRRAGSCWRRRCRAVFRSGASSRTGASAREWAGLEEIAALKWKPGDIVLGKFNGERLGFMDDKPMVTVASARSGKSSTVIIPTLLTYPGSALVLDPKGELAAETAEFRRDVLKQDVHVLDPFGCSGLESSSFNALAELDPASPHLVDDVDKISAVADPARRQGCGSRSLDGIGAIPAARR